MDMSVEYQEDISRKYWKYARWDKDIERERNKPPERIWAGDKTRKTEVPVDQIIFVQTIKGKHTTMDTDSLPVSETAQIHSSKIPWAQYQ